MKQLLSLTVAMLVVSPAFAQKPKPVSSFDREIAPILASYCLDCHSGKDAKGKLNLANRKSAMKGGESGAAIVPGKLVKSLLWQRIEANEMPPKEKLSATAKARLKKWISKGANWGTDPIDPFRFTTSKRAGLDWWSLQPLRRPVVPKVKAQHRVRTPIDAFLLEKLEAKGLTFSADARPRVLLRRVYFDLIGLPPEPKVVADFVKAPTEKKYQQIIDKLLASSHYGERWGRHWLDVVRYGESDGFERNGPRYSLWPYRDWVIRALNQDMPYDQFVRMQLAGDIITKNSADGRAAVGFLVAGVHNTVVGGSVLMKRLARADELEEIVGAVGQTFVGLTVNCGRCHDHKFDPIRQREYYRMTAAIGGVYHGEVPMPPSDEIRNRIRQVEQQLKAVTKEIATLAAPVRKSILAARKKTKKKADPPKAYATWDFDKDFNDSTGKIKGTPVGKPKLENGALVVDGKSYIKTTPLQIDVREKTLETWAVIGDLNQGGGGTISLQTIGGQVFDAIVYAERERRQWMPGSNGFVRTKSLGGPQETVNNQPVHFAIVYTKDGMITAYRNGKLYGKPYKSRGLQAFSKNRSQLLFGLRHEPASGNHFLKARILKANFYDRALSPQAVAASAGVLNDYVAPSELVKAMPPNARKKYVALLRRRDSLAGQSAVLSKSGKGKVYSVRAKTRPDPTYFLRRGNVMDRGPTVSPGAVNAVVGPQAEFGLKKDSSDSSRRLSLANWITDQQNPLFARVMMNRIWHYHFGTGIVATPNDFGFNGSRPSHKRLLDWLATEFQREKFRLKRMHRLILTSTAYRQASKVDKKSFRVDANNRLLWRKSPHRLEAEALRDAMLATAGKLNKLQFGPGFVDVKITPNNGTTYYTPLDREDHALNRRTVYRFWPRGGRSALLDTFDCPDPAAAAPKRTVTTTPLQALSLLNNAFVLRMSRNMAIRLQETHPKRVGKQVKLAFQLTLSRDPDQEELQLGTKLAKEHGLPALARALYNSNGFVVLD